LLFGILFLYSQLAKEFKLKSNKKKYKMKRLDIIVVTALMTTAIIIAVETVVYNFLM